MKKTMQKGQRLLSLLIVVWCLFATAVAQNNVVKGVVVDSQGESVIGATVVLKSDKTVGTTTDLDGNFSLKVPSAKTTLVVSYVGMKSVEVTTTGKTLKITLEEDNQVLDDVVVVGYGQQKKASVVGAITQATGETLQRAAGINNVGQALTGNLPGVITMSSSGMPGEEDPQIIIRGSSSWNGSEPLVLVDGVERKMSTVDMSSVANISVLKDASATAVYGVRGANGVILITTKRGQEGRAQINISANAIMKIPSKLPGKLDSYDAMQMRNIAIENEMNIASGAWAYMKPQAYINNYRNQSGYDEFGNLMSERYPNVDWQDALFEKYCIAYNANLNVSGGNKFVKYFASVDYVSEGDIYKDFGAFRGYETGYDYNRFNVRSNLDFSLTKTTTFRVSIAGSNAVRQTPWSNSVENDWQQSQKWSGIYNIGPDVFMPQYADGTFGFLPHGTNVTNSAEGVATGGTLYQTATTLNTDFALEQDLSFITKGLSFRGSISWDNQFQEGSRGINDLYTSLQHKWINPETGAVVYKETYDNQDQFDYVVRNEWSTQSGSVNNWSTYRRLYYETRLNWVRSFQKHNITAMALFARNEWATGSSLPNRTENWAFRATYDWATRYFAEYSGAYNGSQKFSDDNRFAFFQSGSVGWMISEEPFMKVLKEKKILDMMKFRLSYGEIGDDNGAGSYLYMDQWNVAPNKITLDVSQNKSPYAAYLQTSVGNPNVHWEVVRKTNFGIDYSFLNGLLAGSADIFQDKRSDILVNGGSRAVPNYLGITPSTINKGKVTTKGYEFELRVNKTLENRMHLWANFNMTHAESKILVKDDAPLLPDYRKEAGYAIGQTHSHIDAGVIQNQDELYASPQHDANDNQKLVGDYYIVDFNGDGVVDVDDSAPYGYQDGIPQNTYSATIGWDWKGWSVNMQFYGVNNVTRNVTMTSLSDPNQANVYDQGTWWAENHNGYDIVTPRLTSTPSYFNGTQFLCDGSFIRLKNAEIAYNFSNNLTKKFGVSNLRLFVSGSNLWVWSRMPDDRESNFSSQGGATGAYPTMRRINFGLKFSL